MGDWAELLPDILFMIASRIEVYEDFNSFRSVCTTWQAASLRKGSTRSLQPLRWLMFHSLYEGSVADTTLEIYSFTRDKICRVSVRLNYPLRMTNGWIVTNRWGKTFLLHPFSRHVVFLPPEDAFGLHRLMRSFLYIKKAVLSSSPIFSPEDCVLLIIHRKTSKLGFWKPVHQAWTVMETGDITFEDIIYHRGQFYAVDAKGVIYVCSVSGTGAVVSIGRIPVEPECFSFYLVEEIDNHTSLLIVTDRASTYRVYEVDLSGKGVKEVTDLGSRTIFLRFSYHVSICVKHSKFPPGIICRLICVKHCTECSCACQKGCSVIELPHRREMHLIICNLKDDKVEELCYSVESSSVFPPV